MHARRTERRSAEVRRERVPRESRVWRFHARLRPRALRVVRRRRRRATTTNLPGRVRVRHGEGCLHQQPDAVRELGAVQRRQDVRAGALRRPVRPGWDVRRGPEVRRRRLHPGSAAGLHMQDRWRPGRLPGGKHLSPSQLLHRLQRGTRAPRRARTPTSSTSARRSRRAPARTTCAARRTTSAPSAIRRRTRTWREPPQLGDWPGRGVG